MSLPNYQILIYSTTGELQQIIDQSTPYELKYSRKLNDIGLLAMVMPSDLVDENTFGLDYFIEVLRTHPITGVLAKEETYLARLFHRYRENNEEKFVLGGVSLNHLLLRRVVDPADDPTAAGGYSTKSGAADSVMRQYALEQISTSASAARQMPNLAVPPVTGTAENAGARLRYENLLDVMQDLAQRGDVDFIINRTTDANMELIIGDIGTDRTYTSNYPFLPYTLFDPQRGNIEDPSSKTDYKNQKNYLYLQGQGQGSDRQELQLQGTGVSDSPFNRIEFTADARQAEKGSATELYTEGFNQLYQNRVVNEFTFRPIPTAGGATYHVDWDVGDTVSAQWLNTRVDLRVKGVEITISSDGETINLDTERLDL